MIKNELPKVHSSFYCFYRHVTLPDSPPYQTAYILDISGSCRWFNMGDTHSNRFQCVPMCLFNVFSIGCSISSEETFSRISSCTLLVLISIMVEECFAIPTTMLRWREHAPSSLHRQHPLRHDIKKQDDIIAMYFPPYSNFYEVTGQTHLCSIDVLGHQDFCHETGM